MIRQRKIKRDMNLALDHVLPESGQTALSARLAASPEDAALWDRMQMVDHLLSAEPMLDAPPDFSGKVMAAIAAAPVRVRTKNYAGLGAAFGLILAVVTLVPLVAAALAGLQHWLSDPAALNTLLQGIVMLLNTVAQSVASLFQTITKYAVETPILPALLTTLIPLTMLWGWLMWYTGLRRQQVVYRIPVRVA